MFYNVFPDFLFPSATLTDVPDSRHPEDEGRKKARTGKCKTSRGRCASASLERSLNRFGSLFGALLLFTKGPCH